MVPVFFLASCIFNSKESGSPAAADKKQLIEADLAFATLSEEKGMKAAYIEYIDSNGVLLRPGAFPVSSAGAIDYLIRQDDSQFTLSWKPKDAVISSSGDLGFTYGLYALRPKDRDTVFYGTYVHVWKRQADGSWKFALHSGNEGIGG